MQPVSFFPGTKFELIIKNNYNEPVMTNQKEIPFSQPFIDEQETAEVVRVLNSKWITSGTEVKKFEEKVKKYLDVKTAVAVSSGTAALEISLAVNGVGEGHEVLTTAYTFASTALAVIHRGAEPVFADVRPNTFNIDPDKIEEMIQRDYTSTGTGLRSNLSGNFLKGIIPVHFSGQAAEIEVINDIARRHGLFVIEDAAHAIGAVHKGLKIGKSQNLVCFSFYSNKNLTTGEGGMIVTDNVSLEKKLRMYSLHGISKDNIERYRTGLPFYDIVYPGLKANLTDIQAALGVVQMGKLDRINRLRSQVAAWYDEFLEDVAELHLPAVEPYNVSAWHLYPVLLAHHLEARRDGIIIGLREKGIYPSVHFIPVHFHTYFKNHIKTPVHLPVTEALFRREISLPLFPAMKKNDARYVADSLRDIIAKIVP